MNSLIALGLSFVHHEMTAGAPGDVAVKSAVSALETKIPNPTAKAILTEILNDVVTAGENLAAAIPAP